MDFQIIISNTPRSLSYLKYLKAFKFEPKKIIYLDNLLKNDKSRSVLFKKKFFFPSITIKKFKSRTISKNVSDFILKQKEKYFVYSGYPGEIIKNNKVLKLKKIIHCHPGKLPDYKGSTTIYYSLIKERKIYCSTIILNKKLDSGKILFKKKYPWPKKLNDIDSVYDNYIRSMNLIHVIKNFKKIRLTKQKGRKILPYYVAHPLLRSAVLHNLNVS
tara:strand:- start:2294 stop:2941 length:648 start_codon:yes stop_codon:yes gene_type:complete